MSAKERMFRDVVDPSVKFRSHQGRSVAATIVIEAIAIGGIVIVPMMAAQILPAPPSVLAYVAAEPPPPPPPPPPTKAAPPPETPPTDTDTAPTTEPETIKPEPPIDPGFDQPDPLIGPGIVAGPEGRVDAPPLPPPPPPPPPPAPQTPLRVGGEIRAPLKTKHVSPMYPPIARSAGIQGIVIIEAVIGVTGDVREARVLRSQPILDAAALDAVRQWEFTPTLLNNQPVPVIMTVTVQFTLK